MRKQVSQRHIVGKHNELDVSLRSTFGNAHRHIIGNNHDLCLKIDTPFGIGEKNWIAWPDETVRAALVHARVMIKIWRLVRSARSTQALKMTKINAAVAPLISTRQR